MKTNNKSSMVERHLKSNKGNICHWWGIGWFNFDEDIIIVSNGWQTMRIKRTDFLKCETMSDLVHMQYFPSAR